MNVEKLFTSLEGAYAPNTIKAYYSDFEHLTRWCKQNKFNPLSLSGTKFVRYIEEMVQSLTVATQPTSAKLDISFVGEV